MLFTEGEIGAELAHLYNGSSGSVGETEGGEGGQGQSHTKLFVGQIPRGVDQAYLLPFFSSFGVVSELSVIRDKNDPTSPHQGAAFVTYKTMEAAALAVENLHDKIRLPNVSALSRGRNKRLHSR